MRVYFEGNTNGPFENSHQWWSNPQAYTLTSLVGNTLTLTVPLNTANWYDRGFEPASDVPTDFAAAVGRSARSVSRSAAAAASLAFAGGAAPTNGTASFVLKSYSVS